jgi:hypothetical protein
MEIPLRHKLNNSKASKQRTHRVHGRACACHAALPGLSIAIRSNHCFKKTLDQKIDQKMRKIEEWLIHAEPLMRQGLAEMAQIADAHPHVRKHFPAIPATTQSTPPPRRQPNQHPNKQAHPSINACVDGTPLP